MRSTLIVALGLLFVLAGMTAVPATAADYPAEDARYHSYPEMVRHIKSKAAKHPGFVRVFSIGTSYQGRKLWAAEISDNVGTDEGEPEVLFDGLHHAREHLSGEMPIYILNMLTNQYGKKTALGKRVTNLVKKRRTWIVFMVNPDGLQYDLTGSPYRSWRKNRQPTPGSSKVGTDLNRNYGYRWGCCGGSSGSPGALDYRGPRAWSSPEVRAMRDFVNSRVVNGVQRIKTHITFHTAGEQVLWPYAYTYKDLPADMTALDLATFRAMGKAMARTNGYAAKQSSSLYPTDGDMIDWMYARHRIFSFTFELYPRSGGTKRAWYPNDEVIVRENKRNRDAILYLMGKAWCPYQAQGAKYARNNCGPFFDDLEIGRGWRVNPRGSDTATDGRWVRGDPRKSPLQLGSAVSGTSVLVTGTQSGHDVDGGVTTVWSPHFRVPGNGQATLRLKYWVGLTSSAGPADAFTVRLVDTSGKRVKVLHKVSGGTGATHKPAWQFLSKKIPARFAGQRLAIELTVADRGNENIVEAGVDQVRVVAG